MYTTATLPIHLFADGHLGCFKVLTVVNKAAMNTGVQIPFQVSVFVFFFPDQYPQVKLLDHMVVAFLIFQGPFILF